MDLSGVSKSNGANVHQWSCNNGKNQDWKLAYTKDNVGFLTVMHSNQVLTVQNDGKNNGASFVQMPYENKQNQHYTFKKEGATFKVIVKSTGKCIDVSGASKNNGANIHQVSINLNLFSGIVITIQIKSGNSRKDSNQKVLREFNLSMNI